MIRQTAKIYVLMPSLLALAMAVAAMDMMGLVRRRMAKWAVCLLPVLVACVESRAVIDPTVCLLDRSQAAYAAVQRDAQQDPDLAQAHALVLPLWPGDSHWASLYQHYASLYRIRMLNGYSPIVHEWYRDLVSQRLAGVNGGSFDDGRLDLLWDMGIRYVLFHEDAFPERISAYPAFLTLRRLLDNPRLEFLAQGGSVWSFKLRTQTKPEPTRLPDGPYFPSLRWNGPDCRLEGGTFHADETVWGGRYARIAAGERLHMPTFNHMFAPDPRLWIRLRGNGTGRWHRTEADLEPVIHRVDSAAWAWFPLPLPTNRQAMQVSAETVEGVIEIDMMTLMAGDWSLPEVGETVSLPGCLFFRAGYTDVQDQSANLRPDYDAASNVFYGPRLPFPSGIYRLVFHFSSDAPPGTRLGEVILPNGDASHSRMPVVAGAELAATFEHRVNLPLELRFIYTRAAAISIQAVDFTFVSPHHEEP